MLGGGGIDRENEAGHKFAALAGGVNARVVVVVTPIDLDVLTPDFFTKYRQVWETEYGVPNVTFMDARDRLVADTEEFVAPPAQGNWRLDPRWSSHQSSLPLISTQKPHAKSKRLLSVEVLSGAQSAGAMISAASFLINVTKSPGGMRISRTGMFLDPANPGRVWHPKRHRRLSTLCPLAKQKGMLPMVIAHYPELLGIGIDERTAIIVHNDRPEVTGAGHVEVLTRRVQPEKSDITLSGSECLDLKKRTVIN